MGGGRKGRKREGGRGGRRKEEEPWGKRPQDQNLNMEIAFDIGAGIMLAMGTNTCKSKGERVSKVSVTNQKRGADIGLASWGE